MRRVLALLFAWSLPALAAVPPLLDLPPPSIDGERIINDSFGFLKAREPLMTDYEYALYQKVVPMVKEQPDFAFKLLETILQDDEPESAAFDLVLGNAYFLSKRPQLAEARYRDAVRKHPDFLRAWDDLGVLYYLEGRYEEAIPCFSRVIALGRQDPRVYGLSGYCLKVTGNPVAAEIAYAQAYAIEPNNPEWMDGLLAVLIETEQFARAEALARQLVRREPKVARHRQLHGELLLALGRRLDAIVALDVAASLAPENADLLLRLGDLYLTEELLAEAIAVYQRALPHSSEAAPRLIRYAEALIGIRRYDEAQQALTAAGTQLAPEHRSAWLLAQAELHLEQGQPALARRPLEELTASDPLNGRGFLASGRLHIQESDTAQASLAFEAALLAPESAYAARVELANLATRDRRFRDAVQHVQAALSLQQSPQLQSYLDTLELLTAAP